MVARLSKTLICSKLRAALFWGGYQASLEPHGGILRFKSHDKRKTPNLTTSRRWAWTDSVWDVVGD